jgi:hypothetical protein
MASVGGRGGLAAKNPATPFLFASFLNIGQQICLKMKI